MSSSDFQQNVPIMTKESFSSLVGVSVAVIDKHVRNDFLPVIKLRRGSSESKRTYINVAALREVCISDASDYIAKFGGASNVENN